MGQKRILVTGASGFTGKHFIRHATVSGYQCVALVQSTEGLNLDCENVKADLLNFQALQSELKRIDFDFVVHLAAISFVAHGDVASIYNTNVVGTINLLEAIEQSKSAVQKVIIASSANVYGNNTQLPLSEEMATAPVNDYSVSKCAMEMAVGIRDYYFDVVLTRPFNYTGKWQRESFLVPKIVNAFKQNSKVIELGNLDVSRDFSDVRDVVEAYLLLLESDVGTGTFNICSGNPVSLNKIVEFCREISGNNVNIRVNPDFVRKNEIKVLYGNESKLRGVVGDYRKYSIRETLNWMLEV